MECGHFLSGVVSVHYNKCGHFLWSVDIMMSRHIKNISFRINFALKSAVLEVLGTFSRSAIDLRESLLPPNPTLENCLFSDANQL